MKNVIKPRDFLTKLRNEDITTVSLNSSDLLEIAELGITLPFSEILNNAVFYDILKRAVSDFNADAALTGRTSVDFDDLYTKYSEYVAVLESFIQEPV